MSASSSSPPPESWLELPGGQTFWLKGRCSIGRQPDNDLVLDLPALSRHHALVSPSGGGYTLSDLRSRNGTFLNRTAVTRPTPVRDGDEIRLGDVALRFRCKRRWLDFGARTVVDASAPTQRIDQVHERACWLLLIDIVGFAALNDEIGSEAAVRRMQTWITAVRPLIERHGGTINGYLGDAIFVYWLEETTKPARPLAALRELAGWRPQSPLPFRFVAHHGRVLFTHSDRGEELTGQDVNILFRSEKIAKGFGAPAMLSESAVVSLGLEGQCTCFGRSSIDGMSEFYSFYAPPADFAGPARGA
ncbi:MAG TPA: adenylate/guanylate cyclase domain-containing protein [Opitutaceae bacterium]|nr:adenylate/guanylate cyclase domain-containing protein [Opitutaceae bacterium]